MIRCANCGRMYEQAPGDPCPHCGDQIPYRVAVEGAKTLLGVGLASPPLEDVSTEPAPSPQQDVATLPTSHEMPAPPDLEERALGVTLPPEPIQPLIGSDPVTARTDELPEPRREIAPSITNMPRPITARPSLDVGLLLTWVVAALAAAAAGALFLLL